MKATLQTTTLSDQKDHRSSSRSFRQERTTGPDPDIGRYWLAFIVILSGIVLLLQNLGWIPFGLWFYLVQFWPVLLVFIGLDLVVAKSPLLRWLLFVIGVGFFVAIVLLSIELAWLDYWRWILGNLGF